MKKLCFFLTLIAGLSLDAFSQTQYEVIRDANGNKILKGIITKNELANDSSFGWFAENQKGFTPNAAAVEALKAHGKDVQIVAFGGTWCGDTKTIFPQFFSLLDAAAFSQDRLTVIGVDRSKKTISHLAEAFNVLNVPTFIVMKDGKEVGRVVEYGKYGMFDKELGEILNSIK